MTLAFAMSRFRSDDFQFDDPVMTMFTLVPLREQIYGLTQRERLG